MTRLLLASAATLALAACARGDITGTHPIVGGTPVAVELTTTTGSPLADPPRLRFSGGAGAIVVRYELTDGACVRAQASAVRAGRAIEVTIFRFGDPAALCVASLVGYHYDARVSALAPGVYEIFLTDSLPEHAARVVGHGTVSVLPES